jgi:tetratricopeptide (TPR) repeat protein
MAISYKAMGRLRRAMALEQRVLIINETALGPRHPDTAMTLGNLAAICLAQRRAREALSLGQRALRTARAALGPEHPTVAVLLAIVGEAWYAIGSDARSLFEQVGQIATKSILNSRQPIAINTLRQLAASYGEAGRRATVIQGWLTSAQRDQLALAGIKLYGDGRFAWRRRPGKSG